MPETEIERLERKRAALAVLGELHAIRACAEEMRGELQAIRVCAEEMREMIRPLVKALQEDDES